jgi:hypothetical protein
MNVQVYGISGYAGAGKDTFCTALSKTIQEKEGTPVIRSAFADNLKRNMNLFLTRNLGVSAFTQDPEQKEVIRPLLVCYGETMRKADPDYWVKQVFDVIDSYKSRLNGTDQYFTFIIPDVRYKNEAEAVINSGGDLIHLDADSIDAPNESESKNTPIVRDMATHILKWPRFDESEVEQKVQEICENFYSNTILEVVH